MRALLLDLDGTLVDSAPDLVAAINRLLAEEGRPPMPLARLRPAVSGGARLLLKAAFDITPEHAGYPALERRFLAHYQAAICVESRLFDGMDAALKTLEARGVRWGIVTNKQKLFTRPLVCGLGLLARAACVVSGDDVPRPKPAPDSLRLACALIGVAPQRCVYVGDDARDITAAHAAEMPALAAAWGYLGGQPISAWGADAVIQSPAELLDFF